MHARLSDWFCSSCKHWNMRVRVSCAVCAHVPGYNGSQRWTRAMYQAQEREMAASARIRKAYERAGLDTTGL